MIEVIGYSGLILLLLAWVPQTYETIQVGKTPINLGFVLLYMISSIMLSVYAYLKDDSVFLLLNGLLSIGSGINLYYKLWPREA